MAAKQGHRGREGRGSEQKGGSARDGECCDRLREEADAQRGPGGGRRGAGGFPGEGQCKAFAQMAQGSRGRQRSVCGALSGGRAVRVYRVAAAEALQWGRSVEQCVSARALAECFLCRPGSRPLGVV